MSLNIKTNQGLERIGNIKIKSLMIEKTITEDGTYNASDDGVDGYSSVIVDVDPTPPEPPADGKTRLYISLAEGRLSPVLGLGINGSVDVDWGDGTAHDTLTGSSVSTLVTTPHTYAQSGDYIIILTAAEGTGLTVLGNTFGSLLLTKDGTAGSGSRAYQASIKKVLLGDSITNIGKYAFYNCIGLTSISITNSITNIGTFAFQNCYSLTSINIPSSVTSIGGNVFSNCYGLTSINIPNSVTSIGGTIFANCSNLTRISLPNNATSIVSNMFYSCSSLASINIPSSVTSIGASAFQNCSGLGFIRFEPTTPPVVGSSQVFGGVPADCIIYVPRGTLEDYEDATNYPDDSVYTYVEY